MTIAAETKLVYYYSCPCGNRTFTEARARHVSCVRCGAMKEERIPLEEARARMAQSSGKTAKPPGHSRAPDTPKRRTRPDAQLAADQSPGAATATSIPARDANASFARPTQRSENGPQARKRSSPTAPEAAYDFSPDGEKGSDRETRDPHVDAGPGVSSGPETSGVTRARTTGVMQTTLFDGPIAYVPEAKPSSRLVG